MKNPQSGIFALGTTSHAYLEFDASGRDGHELVRAIAVAPRAADDDGRG